jgi:hypothetical protein
MRWHSWHRFWSPDITPLWNVTVLTVVAALGEGGGHTLQP